MTEGGWVPRADGDITHAQRWTEERSRSILAAYRLLQQKWRSRPWPTEGDAHRCDRACAKLDVNDIVVCLRSGHFHVCGDVCDAAVVTHEARVCAVTGRSMARDFQLDPFETNAPPRPRRAKRRGTGLVARSAHEEAEANVRTILPPGTPATDVRRVAEVVVHVWELVQSSRVAHGHTYTLPDHTLVVVRLMPVGMWRGDLCIVPYDPSVEQVFNTLKALPADDPRVVAHTKTAKAFRRLLHGVDDAALRRHSALVEDKVRADV